MRILISLVSGALFGLGLIISGMTDTKKCRAGWTYSANGTPP